jgi:hypothetical protein
MSSLQERIAGERRRLREVRQSLTASVAQGANGDQSYVAFYIAIGAYFEAAMERLHTQDVRMGDLLQDRADLTLPDNARAMAELAERLAGNQQHLEKMLAARDALCADGAQALPAFEAAGGAYADYIVANMGHHPGTTTMAQELFSEDDWAFMAAVTEVDQRHEQQLFEHVFANKPAGLNLPD